jgi:hypothetical protein
MKPLTDLNLCIPASIVGLQDLNLIEKAILARIDEKPMCPNRSLSKLTGLSVRGVESTLARLKKRGLLGSQGHGQARRLILTFPIEHHAPCGQDLNASSHIQCGENHSENVHTACGVAASAECHTTGGIEAEQSDTEIKQATVRSECSAVGRCIFDRDTVQARIHLDRLRQWYSADCENEPESRSEKKERIHQAWDDIIFALEAISGGFATFRSHYVFVLDSLYNASPAKFTEMRQEIEVAKARGIPFDLERFLER